MTTIDSARAWEVELDRLERAVLGIERRLQDAFPVELDEWVPPSPEVPLPAQLLPRARAIHDRQVRAMGDIARAMQRTGRQRDFAQRIADATASPRACATYIDQSA
ncbi:hypothetical protein V3N99_01480 [Dermatophilaceae bacterium Soc4.6]